MAHIESMISKYSKSSNSGELLNNLAPRKIVFIAEYSQESSRVKACEIASYSKKASPMQVNRMLKKRYIGRGSEAVVIH